MTTIKCMVHPKCDAMYMCGDCGFLCKEHAHEQAAQNHTLIVVNTQITELYNATRNLENVREHSSFMSKIRRNTEHILDLELYFNGLREKNALGKLTKCNYECQGINAQVLSSVISKSLNKIASSTKLRSETELNMLNKLLRDIVKNSKDNKNRYAFKQLHQDLSVGNECKRLQRTLTLININQLVKSSKLSDRFIDENTKFTGKEWNAIYKEVVSKCGQKDNRIVLSKKLLETKSYGDELSKRMMEDISENKIEDLGAIALGYAIRKNAILRSVLILLAMVT